MQDIALHGPFYFYMASFKLPVFCPQEQSKADLTLFECWPTFRQLNLLLCVFCLSFFYWKFKDASLKTFVVLRSAANNRILIGVVPQLPLSEYNSLLEGILFPHHLFGKSAGFSNICLTAYGG